MDIQQIMQQAQAMQTKMQSLQEELGETETEGTAGGGMVSVRATCKGEIRQIDIDDSVSFILLRLGLGLCRHGVA